MHARRFLEISMCASAIAVALAGCGKVKQSDGRENGLAQAQAKRQRSACASSAGIDRLKELLFDQAISQQTGERRNLDTLADYSSVRMEDPVVAEWDPELDITSCRGRLILMLPPTAERGFGGERQLQADIDYTAQAAADGNGFVYKVMGAEAIVAKLAAFGLTGSGFRPPAAIDGPNLNARLNEPDDRDRAGELAVQQTSPVLPAHSNVGSSMTPESQHRIAKFEQNASASKASAAPTGTSDGSYGEDLVRSFYKALAEGDGGTAAALIVPEKRSSGAFTAAAMSRFYGRLPEPIQITGIVPLSANSYRVTYSYSAGRSRCNGRAVVSITRRGERDFIRSIQAPGGC